MPSQGPIGVFIHHNTLHAFQHLPFEEAVQEAAKRFETEPFLTEAAYRKELSTGRIRREDISVAVEREADNEILPHILNRHELRRLMLDPGLRSITPDNFEWLMDEGGLLDCLRTELAPATRQLALDGNAEHTAVRALFAACYHCLPKPEEVAPACPARPRDVLLAWHGTDTDELINAWLIRLCAVFFDRACLTGRCLYAKKDFIHRCDRSFLKQDC